MANEDPAGFGLPIADRATETHEKREDALFRAGLVLFGAAMTIRWLVTGDGVWLFPLSFLVLALAPYERVREQLSFAGHQLPAVAIFGLGLAVALAAITIALIP